MRGLEHGQIVPHIGPRCQAQAADLRGQGIIDGAAVDGADVARMMELLKLSRACVGEYDIDHDRDVAGYAGIAAACEVAAGTADADDLEADLGEEARLIRDTARRFVDERVRPDIGEHFLEGTYPVETIPEMGELGFDITEPLPVPPEFQAVHAANVALGFEETAGLEFSGLHPVGAP